MFKKWLSHRNRFSNMFEGNLKITNKIVKNKFTCTFFLQLPQIVCQSFGVKKLNSVLCKK